MSKINIIRRTVDMVVTHVVASIGYLFFKYACKGIVFNQNYLESVIKERTNFILASNHESYLDWIVLWAIFKYRYRRKVFFLAKEKLFDHWFWGMIMRHAECVKVNNSGSKIIDERSLEFLSNNIIGIFPEGTRSRTGKLQEFKSGVVVFSKKMNSPILPVALNGFYETWPSNSKFPKFSNCEIFVSELIYNTSYPDLKSGLVLLKNTIASSICPVADPLIDIETAVFDVDGTLTKTTIADFLFFIQKRRLSKFHYQLWKLKIYLVIPFLLLLDQFNRPLVQLYVYNIYAKIPYSYLMDNVQDYFQHKMKDAFFESSLNLLNELKDKGNKITLLSTNLNIVIEQLAKYLNVDFEAVDLVYLDTLSLRKRVEYLETLKFKYMNNRPSKVSIGIGDSKYDQSIYDFSSIALIKMNAKNRNSALAAMVNGCF